jgi:hypothetical protein
MVPFSAKLNTPNRLHQGGVGNFGGRKVKINDISHIFRPELSPPALALLPEILVLLPENKQRDKCPPPTVIWPHFGICAPGHFAQGLTSAGWKFNVGWLEILQPAHLKFFQPANLEDRYYRVAPNVVFSPVSR